MSNTNKLLKDGLTLLSNNQMPEAIEWCTNGSPSS